MFASNGSVSSVLDERTKKRRRSCEYGTQNKNIHVIEYPASTSCQQDNQVALLAALPLFSSANNVPLSSYGGRKSKCPAGNYHEHELRGATEPGSPQYRYMRELFANIVLEIAKDHRPLHVFSDGSIPLPTTSESESVDNFNARWLAPIVRACPTKKTSSKAIEMFATEEDEVHISAPCQLTVSMQNLNVHQFLQAHEMEFFSRTCRYYRETFELKKVIPLLARRFLHAAPSNQIFNLGFMLEPYSAECDHQPECPGDYYLAALLGGRADICYHERLRPHRSALTQLEQLGYRIQPHVNCIIPFATVQHVLNKMCEAVSTIPLIDNVSHSRVLADLLSRRQRKFRFRVSHEINVTGCHIAMAGGVAVRCSAIKDFDIQLTGIIVSTHNLYETMKFIARSFKGNKEEEGIQMPFLSSENRLVFLPRGTYSQMQTLTWLHTISTALRKH
jgi:hypothetical protein